MKSSLDKVTLRRFNPPFTIEGTPVTLHPLKMVSVATDKLGKLVVATLSTSHQQQARGQTTCASKGGDISNGAVN
jgi:hypothetical protein